MNFNKILRLSILLLIVLLIPSMIVLATATRNADSTSALLRVPGGLPVSQASMDQPQDMSQWSSCILLVDDDNNSPDVLPLYSGALDDLGYAYSVFDIGGGDGDGPDLETLLDYKMVIWFSGDKSGAAGPNGTDEVNLAAYLDSESGGHLFLSSQDYLADYDLTSFGQDYLGIAAFEDNQGDATTKYGSPGDPIGSGLGPYPLSYPSEFINNRGDRLYDSPGTSIAFRNSPGGNILDIDLDGGNWKTVFFGTSWVLVNDYNTANGAELLGRIVEWFGGCEPQIELTKTVGLDPNACATDDSIDVMAGSEVTYCYEVTNTGVVPLTLHNLVDSELGVILDDEAASLPPMETMQITQTTTILADTINTATWTAYVEEGGDFAVASDSATVNVLAPEIELSKTVGTDPAACATTDSIEVLTGSEVTYCYQVTNTGDFTLGLQYLVDTELGDILDGTVYELAPGASTLITQTTTILTDTVNYATWIAYIEVDGGFASAEDSASVTVLLPDIELRKTVGRDPSTCSTTDNISVGAGSEVTYCFEVTNTGEVTFTLHDLVDDQMGAILSDFPYILLPGASAQITQTATILTDTINTAIWSAFVDENGIPASATASAAVTIEGKYYLPVIFKAP